MDGSERGRGEVVAPHRGGEFVDGVGFDDLLSEVGSVAVEGVHQLVMGELSSGGSAISNVREDNGMVDGDMDDGGSGTRDEYVQGEREQNSASNADGQVEDLVEDVAVEGMHLAVVGEGEEVTMIIRNVIKVFEVELEVISMILNFMEEIEFIVVVSFFLVIESEGFFIIKIAYEFFGE